jgi:ZIP family zinc transporter
MSQASMRRWLKEASKQAIGRPFWSMSVFIALLAVLLMMLQSADGLFTEGGARPLKLAFMAGMGGFVATGLGALPALLIRAVPTKIEDSMLGFAAGMMLAASSFSLIIPGVEAGSEVLSSNWLGSLVVVLGLAVGVILMLGLEQFIPHKHTNAGGFGPAHESYGRMLLFVFAIALHNLPEGMAIGVSFARADMNVGLPVSTAIAIQDVPEGFAVALALRGITAKAWKGVAIAALTGALEPLGAIVGVSIASGVPLAYPIAMGVSAGAMLFVVSHEVIPETHRNGHQTFATIGLMIGFALMMLLDTALG